MSLEAFLALHGIGLVTGIGVAVIAVAPILRARLASPRRLVPIDDEAQWTADIEGHHPEPVAAPERKRA